MEMKDAPTLQIKGRWEVMKGMYLKEKELSTLNNRLGGSSHHKHKLIPDGLYFNIKSRTQNF